MVLLVAGLLLTGSVGEAGQERYEYDPIGRLVRFIDSSNEVTDYTYDAAGNILSVTRGGSAGLAPALSSVTPSFIRRGETKALTITGQRLGVGTLQTSDAGLDLSNVRLAAAQVTADLTVAQSVPTGTQTLTFSNALGSAQIGLLIAPKLPTLSVEPSPLALPPDNIAHAVTLRLSGADVVSHAVAIASTDTAKATVSPAGVTIAAGQTTALVNITAKTAGFVNLSLSSATLGTVTVPVFVTVDFRGVNTSEAAAVGVMVGDGLPTAANSGSATFTASRVGVAVGPVLTGVSPDGMVVGATHNLAVSGLNLPTGLQVSVVPSQGVTATITTSDTQQIAVSLTADASAAAGVRRLVVTDAANKLVPFADPSRSQIRLTTGQPVITSIEPLFATAGTTPLLKVRGMNLQDGRLLVSPSIDLSVDAGPVVNAEGTELIAGLQIFALAASGPRVVQVATLSGNSTSQAGPANQFTIVREITNAVTPITAPLVGVVVGSSVATGTDTVGPVQAAHVGLVVGPVAFALSPQVGLVDSTITLVVTGTGLQGVQTATLAPLTGLTLGPVSIDAEGTSLSMQVAVAADAPRTPRRMTLQTPTGRLTFSKPDADQFLVVAPPPTLISITPQVIPAGTTRNLVVRGQNFSDLLSVQIEPSTGLTVGAAAVSDGNTVLTVGVQASAGAPTGVRTLIVNTAGGASSSVASPANTFQVAQQVSATYDAVAAAPVGVTVGASTSPPMTDTIGVQASLVGVMVTPSVNPTTQTESVHAMNVGVVVGAAAAGVSPRSPDGFIKGTSSTLTIDGFALTQVSSVVVSGSGVTLGALSVNAEGTQLTLPVTVSGTAPSSTYGVQLRTGTGTATVRVTAVTPANMLFNVGALPTTMDSVSPIVLEQGKSYALTVRGVNLMDAFDVLFEPTVGTLFSAAPQWSTDALGEKLTISLVIDPNAAIGSRVLRLRVPGGMTTAEPLPANTITIVAPQ